MPTIDEFLKKSKKKKFSKTSEENWKIDVSPPDIKSRRRPGRGSRLGYDVPSPTPEAPGDDASAVPSGPVPSGATTREQEETTREQPRPAQVSDSAATAEHPSPDSAATREQMEDDSVATRQQTTSDSVATREQIDEKPPGLGSKHVSDSVAKVPDSVAKSADSVANAPELGSETDNATESTLTHSVAKHAEKRANSVATRQQKRADSVATREQTTPDSVATREQKGANATESTPTLLPSQKTDSVAVQEPDSVAKRAVNKTLLPRSSHQVTLLRFLLDQQMQNDSVSTPMLSRVKIAKATGIDKGTLKNAIDRLVTKKLVFRNTFSNACTRGGTVYSVANTIKKELLFGTDGDTGDSVANTATDSVAKRQAGDSVANGMVSSSSYLNTTTTNNGEGDKALSEAFQAISQRLGLEDRGIGANDLLEVWRKGVFTERVDLEASLEHLAFYLGTPAAESINHPKAWMLGQLRKGYYPEPAGFKTWEERQEEAKLEDARKRAERVGELRRKRFEAEFEVWLAELSEEKKKQIAGGVSIGSRAALAMLRSAFAEERGMDIPTDS